MLRRDLGDWQPGHIPGVDGAGTVVALGAGVDPLWLGRRVAYHLGVDRHGSFADHVPVPTHMLLHVPDVLDFALAAGMPAPVAVGAWTPSSTSSSVARKGLREK